MHRNVLATLLIVALAACAGDARDGDSAVTARDTTAVAAPDGVIVPTPADSGCSAAPIADSSAGPVRLGMRVDEITARCPGAHDSSGTREGMPVRTLVVPIGSDTVAASIVDGRAWRLAVVTPGLRTRDSLGVGTPLTRLLTLPGARALTGEGRTYVVADEPCGLSFELSEFASKGKLDAADL